MKQLLLISLLFCSFQTVLLAQKTGIIFIGNSITQGVILKDPQQTSPPSQTMDWLRQHYEGDLQFQNCGVSGRTTTNFLPVMAMEFIQVKEAADAFQREERQLVFSMMLGTNDSAVKGPMGAPLPPQGYYTNMKAIADELLRLYPSCKILLHRPIWYSPNTYNNTMYLKEGLARLESYFPILKQLSADYALTHPGQVLMGDTLAFDHFRENKKLYFAEEGNAGTFNLHPNEEGAKTLAAFWGKAILEVLQGHPSYNEFSLDAVKEEPLPSVKKEPTRDADTQKELPSPSLRIYLPSPEKATGRMVIALPGGGYGGLALFHEGFDWAPYFLSKGIAYGVLKYRMPAGDHTIPFADVEAAFSLVKEHAAEWNVNPDDIGIMGSSAGGHLASTYATHTKAEDKPAFQILLYPVITMDASFTHAGSRKNLLGENPSQEMIDRFSNEKRVDELTPPTFMIFAADDKAVPPVNGFRYAEALTQHSVPVTFLLYPTGSHGFGNRDSFTYKKQFLQELDKWLEGNFGSPGK